MKDLLLEAIVNGDVSIIADNTDDFINVRSNVTLADMVDQFGEADEE